MECIEYLDLILKLFSSNIIESNKFLYHELLKRTVNLLRKASVMYN
jgi:hypothetical protein